MKKEQIVQFINEDKPLSRLIHDYDISFYNDFDRERYDNIALKQYIEQDLCSSFKHIFESDDIDKIRAVLFAVQNLWTESSKTYVLNEIIFPYLNNADKELTLILQEGKYGYILDYFNDKLIRTFNCMDHIKEVERIKSSIIKTNIDICKLTKNHQIYDESYVELACMIHKIKDLGEYKEEFKPFDFMVGVNTYVKNVNNIEAFVLFFLLIAMTIMFVVIGSVLIDVFYLDPVKY